MRGGRSVRLIVYSGAWQERGAALGLMFNSGILKKKIFVIMENNIRESSTQRGDKEKETLERR